ncbi:MAG: 2-oxo acid dehydrogenase subunit E2, partial [Sphingobacteriaceae bacterium]|nr:2-oxo acid dehydrogenase subunit E2 [Sphingobacteriaceae bacterium]
MAQYELLLPKMGESVAEATIIKWLKQPGDVIQIDDIVLEIATDKVDSEVPSPVSGKLIKQLFNNDDVVQVGAAIAIIEIEGAEVEKPSTPIIEKVVPEVVAEKNIPFVAVAQTSETKPSSDRFYSPLVKSIASQENISLSEL